MRLYCFPHAGGGVPVFRDWPDGLPEVEVWIAHLPGRGSRLREAPLTRMLPLVQALARNFPQDDSKHWPASDHSFAFFGHSLGARLAFELTRTLRRQSRPLPAHLFLSACPAPQLLPVTPAIHTLPKSAFLTELQRRNGIPQEVAAHPELMDLLLPMLRADFAVYETAVYRSESPLACPITAFGGNDDPLVSSAALEAWSVQTSGAFQASFFDGDHFYLRTAEGQLLQQIGRILSS